MHPLPAYAIESYDPAGHRFRLWYSNVCTDQEIKRVMRCVLLLALVCPKFDYAAAYFPVCDKFMTHMKKMIGTDGFCPYATRLRWLLFGGAQNKIPNVKAICKRDAEIAEITAAFRAARLEEQAL
ncbi:hypothetical protein GGI20_005263 [Coemansia sp. BCRC 34301]|nr:hypothetical protein GGI20_005263 [Coemansia sp. BCRC 34301]